MKATDVQQNIIKLIMGNSDSTLAAVQYRDGYIDEREWRRGAAEQGALWSTSGMTPGAREMEMPSRARTVPALTMPRASDNGPHVCMGRLGKLIVVWEDGARE